MRVPISAIGVLALFGCGCVNPASAGPVVLVSAIYPGADANAVADIIAAPIEQQINGAEGLILIESESRKDGSYAARLHFKHRADPKIALTLIQNRVALAQPILPELVQKAGVTVKLATADDVAGTGEGAVSGATVELRYRLRLPEAAGGWEVDVTDWLYRGADGVIVNRAQFRRFGILVGELVGSIRPVGE